MKTTTTLTLLILVTTTAFTLGMNYGVTQGVKQYALLEEVAVGAISRHQLGMIERGELEDVIFTLELNIDTALDRYARYQEGGNRVFSEYYFPSHTENLESYVDLMAGYRTTHPVVFNADWATPAEGDDAGVKAFKAQGHAESLEMLERIHGVLSARGIPLLEPANQ